MLASTCAAAIAIIALSFHSARSHCNVDGGAIAGRHRVIGDRDRRRRDRGRRDMGGLALAVTVPALACGRGAILGTAGTHQRGEASS
jgi:hypothetical protein